MTNYCHRMRIHGTCIEPSKKPMIKDSQNMMRTLKNVLKEKGLEQALENYYVPEKNAQSKLWTYMSMLSSESEVAFIVGPSLLICPDGSRNSKTASFYLCGQDLERIKEIESPLSLEGFQVHNRTSSIPKLKLMYVKVSEDDLTNLKDKELKKISELFEI